MGVPKLFKWLKDRYPLISQSGQASFLKSCGILPKIDDLFIDANSIIHSCTHPEFGPVPKSEAEMFQRIGLELDAMVSIVAPRRTFFVAVDGVAPRAKLNQQRARRFRAASEAPTGPSSSMTHFDPNSITPGTPFMSRLSSFLRTFLQSRINEEHYPPKIIYSGHEIPGEGEHKIMDEIRSLRSKDLLGTVCIHGIDADLIMLALATQHRHCVLLREQKPFVSPKKELTHPIFLNQLIFDVLHVSILRDYLCLELGDVDHGHSDDSRIISDFVLLAMLAGNDFLPHLPGCHFDKGSMDRLFQTYLTERQPDEYLTQFRVNLNLHNASTINWGLLARILQSPETLLPDVIRLCTSSTARLPLHTSSVISPQEGSMNSGCSEENSTTPPTTNVDASSETESDDEPGQDYSLYYEKKLSLDREAIEPILLAYVRVLLWTWIYYFYGLASWNVFYPYHYAPIGADLGRWLARGGPQGGLSKLVPGALWGSSKGSPLRPLEQLLAVLPIASGATLLPEPIFHLMSQEPLAPWYPLSFTIDANEKKRPWEFTILIPFIDESKLLTAVRKVESLLKPKDRALNRQFNDPLIWTRGPTAKRAPIRWWPSMKGGQLCKSFSWKTIGSSRQISKQLQLKVHPDPEPPEHRLLRLVGGHFTSNWPYHPYPLVLLNQTHKEPTALRVMGMSDGSDIFYLTSQNVVERRAMTPAEVELFILSMRVFETKSFLVKGGAFAPFSRTYYYFGTVEHSKHSSLITVNGVMMRPKKDFFLIPCEMAVVSEATAATTSNSDKIKKEFTSPYDYFVKEGAKVPINAGDLEAELLAQVSISDNKNRKKKTEMAQQLKSMLAINPLPPGRRNK